MDKKVARLSGRRDAVGLGELLRCPHSCRHQPSSVLVTLSHPLRQRYVQRLAAVDLVLCSYRHPALGLPELVLVNATQLVILVKVHFEMYAVAPSVARYRTSAYALYELVHQQSSTLRRRRNRQNVRDIVSACLGSRVSLYSYV